MEMDILSTATPAPEVGANATKATEATQPVQQTATSQTPTQSDKAQRFKNRAETQASKVMAEMEKLQKLSNRRYYTYTPEQISELFAAMQTALDEVKTSFTTDNVEKKRFTFSV